MSVFMPRTRVPCTVCQKGVCERTELSLFRVGSGLVDLTRGY